MSATREPAGPAEALPWMNAAADWIRNHQPMSANSIADVIARHAPPPAPDARQLATAIVNVVCKSLALDKPRADAEAAVLALLPATPAAGDAEAVAVEIEHAARGPGVQGAAIIELMNLAARVRLLGRQGGQAELLREAADVLSSQCGPDVVISTPLIQRLRAAAAAGGAE